MPSRRFIPILSVALLFANLNTAHADKSQSKIDESRRVVTYYKKGLFFQTKDGSHSLKINIQTQFRHRYLGIENAPDNQSFIIRKARLMFNGSSKKQHLTFRMQIGMDVNTNAALFDFYGIYSHSELLKIKVGQFRVPFSREYLLSSFKLSFADYTNQFNNFGLNRDVGFNIHGYSDKAQLEYNLFLVNGNNRAIANSNIHPVFGARAHFGFFGRPTYSVNDLHHSKEVQLNVGGAIAIDTGSDNPDISADKLLRVTGDANFLYRSFTASAEFHWLRNFTNSSNDFGLLGHLSYFLMPKKWEIAARGQTTVRNDSGALGRGGTDSYEVGFATGYYFAKRSAKLVFDYNLLFNLNSLNTAIVADQKIHLIRSQVQFIF